MISLEKVQSLVLPGLQQPGPFSTWVLPLLEADWTCLHFITVSEHLVIGSGKEEAELITAPSSDIMAVSLGGRDKDITSSGATETIPALQMSCLRCQWMLSIKQGHENGHTLPAAPLWGSVPPLQPLRVPLPLSHFDCFALKAAGTSSWRGNHCASSSKMDL